MKNYSGIYKVQNRDKYKGRVDEVVYRSRWELFAFKWCDTNENVIKWSSEEIVVPYVYEVDNKFHRYFLDLYIEFKNGEKLLVEIKPAEQTKPPKKPKKKTKRYIQEGFMYIKNQNKWTAAEKYAKRRGWKFVIWTENELTEMGIMPKMFAGSLNKKLKPLPRPKKHSKRKNK